jgi:GT2 family glycosyltransferase
MKAKDARVGICIPVYNHIDNENLAQAIWTLENCAMDVDYQLQLGIGRNCVARNRNKALARLHPTTRYVLMADDDILAPPDYLGKMMEIMDDNEDIGALSACMLGARGQRQNDCSPYNIPDGVSFVDNVNIPGTFFMYDRIKTPVEFDERYQGSQWEDTDAMRQIQAAGFRTVVTSEIQILHRNNWSQNKYWEENKALFYSKWGKR